MNLADWHAYVESAPITPAQRGRIMAECDRLGVDDRAERLAILGALAGVDGLGSTAELTQAKGGYLVNLLQHTRDRAALPDVTAPADDEDQDDEHDNGKPMTLGEALTRAAVMIYAISQGDASGIIKTLSREGRANCPHKLCAPARDGPVFIFNTAP